MMIKDLIAREILDSRGNPTVEVELFFDDASVISSVPSGASCGTNEALELRDGGNRYHGKGVMKAVNNVNTIIKNALIGMELNQEKIDLKLIELDGTDSKRALGANAILGVSLCVMKALAKKENKELYEYVGANYQMPIPMMNIINGGVHASSGLAIQEFMIVPRFNTFKDILQAASEIFHTLKSLLKSAGFSTAVGDEGGFAPTLKNTKEALDYIIKAINEAGYIAGKNVFIALDCAASEFYNNGEYKIDGMNLSSLELMDFYEELINGYPIISIEDAFSEFDIEAIREFTNRVGNKIMLVGDDYFVTNKLLLAQGIEEKYNNAILLKANQIGTITEMFSTIKMAKENGFKTIISHRSGETMDTFIADLAVGLNLGYIKTGSLCRGERVEKYNRLLRIEEKILKNANTYGKLVIEFERHGD